MNNILIDERQCGAGKTRPTGNNNSVIDDLKVAYDLGHRSVVVIPTIDLMNEYVSLVREFITPNLEGVRIINSDVCDNTSRAFSNALMNQDRIILVTHVTWTRLPERFQGITRDMYLFIDEAIQTTDMVRIVRNESEIEFHWDSAITCTHYQPELDYQIIEVDSSYFGSHSLISDSTQMQKLVEPRRIRSIRTEVLEAIQSGNEPHTFEIYLELDPELMLNWRQVRIAAARFGDTDMRHWLDKAGMQYSVIRGCEFQKHTSPIRVHMPDTHNRFTWSKTRQQAGCVILDDMKQYVVGLDQGQDWLSLANVGYEMELVQNQTHGTHRAHGMNAWRHNTHIVFHSALNPSSSYKQFLRSHDGYHPVRESDPIFNAMCGYEFYQFIMRGAARSGQAIDVVILDHRLLDVIYELWASDAIEVELWDTPEYRTHPDTQITLTKKQLNRSYYLRKKNDLDPNWTPIQVLEYMGELDSTQVESDSASRSISPIELHAESGQSSNNSRSHSSTTPRMGGVMSKMRRRQLDQRAAEMDNNGSVSPFLERLLRRAGRWMGA